MTAPVMPLVRGVHILLLLGPGGWAPHPAAAPRSFVTGCCRFTCTRFALANPRSMSSFSTSVASIIQQRSATGAPRTATGPFAHPRPRPPRLRASVVALISRRKMEIEIDRFTGFLL